MIDYSIIIRTMGKAGKKYEVLLESISKLVPQPKEVIVVLPEGYSLPKERLGGETFYFSKKGMVTQRLYGIYVCKSKYALVCDDDISFDSDFVNKLYSPIEQGVAKISSGPLLSYLPSEGFMSFLYAITGAAIPKLNCRGKYISILPTTGYSYYRKLKKKHGENLIAESLPWTCFFGEIEAIKKIRLDEEKWLELNGYAAMDDQTMFYKAYLRGIKTVIVTDALYEHLDAKTSRTVTAEIAYPMEFNRYIFWHRFIYSMDSGGKKLWDILCINYYLIMKSIYNRYRFFQKQLDKKSLQLKKQAIKDAKKYIKNSEYLNLPNVMEKRCKNEQI